MLFEYAPSPWAAMKQSPGLVLYCIQGGGSAVARGLLRVKKVLVSLWGGRKRMVLADVRGGIGGMLLPKASDGLQTDWEKMDECGLGGEGVGHRCWQC